MWLFKHNRSLTKYPKYDIVLIHPNFDYELYNLCCFNNKTFFVLQILVLNQELLKNLKFFPSKFYVKIGDLKNYIKSKKHKTR